MTTTAELRSDLDLASEEIARLRAFLAAIEEPPAVDQPGDVGSTPTSRLEAA